MNRLYILYIILECVAEMKKEHSVITAASLASTDTLQMVQTIFRHGERNPSNYYANDPHKDHQWPEGWYQLSNRGKVEMHKLGLSMRKRYGHFLPARYHADDVYTYSSYADRCHMSAQLVHLGLYPPSGDQVWNAAVLWQPIPVQSLPRLLDNIVAFKKPCPRYSLLFQQLLTSEPDVTTLLHASTPLFTYLSNHSGQPVDTLRKLESLYNTLDIERANNLTLPPWTSTVFPEPMKQFAAASLSLYAYSRAMKRLHGGMLLAELLEHMVKRQSEMAVTLTRDTKKIYLYSGHDLTLVTVMRLLGMESVPKPNFGAALYLELHLIDGKYFVKIFYQSNPHSRVEGLAPPIPGYANGSNNTYSLETFTNHLSQFISENWEEECLQTSV